MKFGICNLSIVAGRAEPSDRSEMVTQLLFGEHYKILEERAKWVKIRLAFDGYECWIDKLTVCCIPEASYKDLSKNGFSCCHQLTGILRNTMDNSVLPVVMGGTLPKLRKDICKIEDIKYVYEGRVTKNSKKINKKQIAEDARQYLNTPYLWGGRSPFGIDCSGFTQVVYKLSGIKLPRDSSEQAKIGQAMSFIEEAEPGDLVFFDDKEGKIMHVGIVLGDNYVIHASGKVRIDRIDHQGIYNPEIRDYSHRLRIIKRVV